MLMIIVLICPFGWGFLSFWLLQGFEPGHFSCTGSKRWDSLSASGGARTWLCPGLQGVSWGVFSFLPVLGNKKDTDVAISVGYVSFLDCLPTSIVPHEGQFVNVLSKKSEKSVFGMPSCHSCTLSMPDGCRVDCAVGTYLHRTPVFG